MALLQQMQQKGREVLYVKVKRVLCLSDSRLSKGQLRVELQGQRHQHKVDLTAGDSDIDSLHFYSCEKDSVLRAYCEFEGEEQINSYAEVSLNKLSAMPKVKHLMEVKLALMKEGEVEQPVKNLVQLDLIIIYVPKIKGRLVISAIDLKLARDTDVVGQLDPFIELSLQSQMFRTSVKVDQGLKGIWREVQSFLVSDIANKGVLKLRVWDEDQTSNDIVGGVDINLLQSNLCVPLQDPAWREFTLHHDNKQAGTVMLEYMFVPLPL